MVVGGGQQETLDSCFVLPGTRQQDVHLHENSDMLEESDLAKAATLSDHFYEGYSTGIVNNKCHNHTNKIPVVGLVYMTEETVL
ncbi:unnamed protein product [Schistosoma margrebowiei]|uniref:Uncharacterized protein n=1 Tax=Schistosoma margrebowiei TaxID=48269 RepID=A0A183N3D7_9TREM|nr:unnamed protein product [Schistosoma margrebowiei]